MHSSNALLFLIRHNTITSPQLLIWLTDDFKTCKSAFFKVAPQPPPPRLYNTGSRGQGSNEQQFSTSLRVMSFSPEKANEIGAEHVYSTQNGNKSVRGKKLRRYGWEDKGCASVSKCGNQIEFGQEVTTGTFPPDLFLDNSELKIRYWKKHELIWGPHGRNRLVTSLTTN